MSNLSVLEIIHQVLEKGPAPFETIFNAVENHYQKYWERYAEDSSVDYSELLIKKRGEIYTNLIISGKTVLGINENNEEIWYLR